MSETFPSESPVPPPRRGGGRVTALDVEVVAALLPQYEVSALLGHGGMGAVYYGRQATLDRPVALKLLGAEVSADAVFASRFVREARAMARLTHPNIAAVYDFGQTAEGHLYFVMEYVDGANLHQLIKAGELDPARALSIFDQVCEALEFAHAEGVIHRDIKPSNVLVDRRGRTKVADFGLARIAEDGDPSDGFVTQTGVVMGTPAYMAPEQKGGLHVDHRADIYSLGVLLYESLTGRIPQGVFMPPSRRVPALNPRIDGVVERALQEEPEDRFQSTAEMRAALREAQTTSVAGSSTLAEAVEHAAPAAKAPRVVRRGRSPWLSVVAPGIALLALMLAIGWNLRKAASTTSPKPASPKSTAAAKPTPVPTPAAQARGVWILANPTPSSEISASAGGFMRLHGRVPIGRYRATNAALRATVRLTNDQARMVLSLRSVQEQEVRAELRANTCALESENPQEYVKYGNIAFPSKIGQWVEVQFAAVGGRLYGTVDGNTIPTAPLRESPREGSLGILGNGVDLRDVSIMLLDGSNGFPAWISTPAAATPAPAPTPPPATPPPTPTPAPTPAPTPPPTPTPTPTPANSQQQQEVAKWLAQVDAENQASFQQEVTQPFNAAITTLRDNYRVNLDRQILLSTQARRPADVKAWQKERQEFNTGGQTVRESDYDHPSEPVRQLRLAYRAAAARLEQDHAARAKAAYEKYEKILQPNIAALTQRDRGEDAAILQHRLDEVKNAWLAIAPSAAPALATPTPAPAAPTLHGTVELLPRIEIGRDTRAGVWRSTKEGLYLVTTPDHYAVCEIPYEPPAEYDFEVQFRPLNDGLNVNLYLTAQGHSFAWKMDAHGGSPPFYGFELYDGKTSFYNPAVSTRVSNGLRSGQHYTTRVEVRRNSLRSYLDGTEYVTWTGDFNRFSMEPLTTLRDPRHLGIGAFDRSVLFEKITLREYSGGGR